MDREPAGVRDAEPPRPAARGSRRLRAAGVLILVALTAAVAIRLDAATGTAKVQAAAPRSSPAATATPSVAAIYQRLRPSVVVVRTASTLGTGVVVADDGSVLTANHVVAGASGLTVTFFDGTTAQAIVASADPKLDIALLRPAAVPHGVVPANIGGGAEVGAPVVTIGNPLGLADSVSAGVVSGLGRTADTTQGSYGGLIQFDAAINPGSSGGPLLDGRGLVIGIVVSIANPAHEDAFAGIGFAVPIGAALSGGGGSNPRGPQL
jgi:putative serine protease PepD